MARSIFAPASEVHQSLVKPYLPLEQREEIRLPESRMTTVVEALRKQGQPKPMVAQTKPEEPEMPVVEEAEEEEKPLTNKEKADLVKSYATGALELGKGAYQMAEAERLGKLEAEMLKKKGEAQAASDVTSGKVGSLGSYISNLRAALGRKV